MQTHKTHPCWKNLFPHWGTDHPALFKSVGKRIIFIKRPLSNKNMPQLIPKMSY